MSYHFPAPSFAYPAVVVVMIVSTVGSAFVATRMVRSYGALAGYFAGLCGGILTLVLQAYFVHYIKWDDVFFALLLPAAGLAAAIIWPARSELKNRLEKQLLSGVLLAATAALVFRTVYLQHEFVDVPFEAGRKGSIADIQYRVPSRHMHSFRLNLIFNAHDRQDRTRVRQLAGEFGSGSNSSKKKSGLAIPVRLTIERIAGSKSELLLDEVFAEHEFSATGGSYFSKRIAFVSLDDGRYRVRIEALENIGELEGIPIRFAFGVWAPK